MAEGDSEVLTRGERVYLRWPQPEDRDAWCHLAEVSEDLRGPWVPGPKTDGRTDTPRWFQSVLALNAAGNNAKLLICRNEDDAILGMLNFNEIVRGAFQNAYLGYWIGAPHARQGYMREAMRVGLAWAFGPLGLHRVEANIQPGNEASIALVRSVGFVQEGFSERYLKIGGAWRDHERWAITQERWEALGDDA